MGSNRSRTIINFGKRTCSIGRIFQNSLSLKNGSPVIPRTGGSRIARPWKPCSVAPDSIFSIIQRAKYSSAGIDRFRPAPAPSTHLFGGMIMIEAVMIWNEPNNKSHWDFEIDPEWRMFSEIAIAASDAVAAANPQLLRVFGGISPIDPKFIQRMKNFATHTPFA